MTRDSTTYSVSWLVDGTGAPLRSDVLLTVDDGRIASIENNSAELPERVIDLRGHTVTPPWVDAHLHMFMSSTADIATRENQLIASYEELLPTMRAHRDALIRAGIFAVRDGGDAQGRSLRFRDEELEGSPLTVRSPGRAWKKAKRYGTLIGRAPAEGQTLAAAIAASDEPIDHVKVAQSGLNSLVHFGRLTKAQFSLEELSAAVAAATDRGLSVMVHANGPEPVEIAARAGCASIEHGFFMGDEVLGLLADRNVHWVPTAVTMRGYAQTLPKGDPRREVAARNVEDQLHQLERARELGVTVVCGTDAGTLGVPHGESLAIEMSLLREAGFTLEQTFAAASSVGTDLLGLRGEFGRLVPGAPASFLAFEGPPETVIGTMPTRRLYGGQDVNMEHKE